MFDTFHAYLDGDKATLAKDSGGLLPPPPPPLPFYIDKIEFSV